MPIRTIETKQTVVAAVLTDERVSQLYSLIESFLIFNPEPSDEQVHLLAAAAGLSKEELEQYLFKFFGQVIEDEEDEEAAVDPAEPSESPTPFISRVKVTSSEPHSKLMEFDGVEDPELSGEEDPVKQASESDGAVDEEVLQEQQGKS